MTMTISRTCRLALEALQQAKHHLEEAKHRRSQA